MSQRIADVLNRRTDLSTFVAHLTRARDGRSARDALISMFADRRISPMTPMGWAKDQDDPNDPRAQSQRVVCFSETPLEHAYSLVADIEGRQIRLEPYGVAFTKLAARRKGINPVWYVDMTPGRDWTIRNALEELKAEAIATGAFHSQPAAAILPYFEQMGTWPQSQKEFWWEREWRHVGDVVFPNDFEGVLWLYPEDEADAIAREAGRRLEPWIDPRWGLEQIIAHLAGFDRSDVTPFAPHRAEPQQDWLEPEEGVPF